MVGVGLCAEQVQQHGGDDRQICDIPEWHENSLTRHNLRSRKYPCSEANNARSKVPLH